MRRAIIPALLLVLVSVVLGATVFREQVAHAAAVLLVREQNTDAQGNIKVHEQGMATVSVAGPVQTHPVIPARAFSIAMAEGSTFTNETLIGSDPAGTSYAITSVTFANLSDSPSVALLRADYYGPPDTCDSDAVNVNHSPGPVMEVPPRSTVHLDFPQPFVMSAQAGANSCLVLHSSGYLHSVTVAGYRL
jgi:hypothetical protein